MLSTMLDYRRRPFIVCTSPDRKVGIAYRQTIEFDPDGAALLSELFWLPVTRQWRRLCAWPASLRNHLLK